MIGRAMSARLSSPILIGRVPEMATLEEALGRAEDGEPVVVLVGGEAGIGKSRLVRELADRARERGDLVLEGGCVSLGSDEGLPFAPIAEALRGLARVSDRAILDGLIDPATRELARLVPELLDDHRDLRSDAPPEWAQTRLFDGFIDPARASRPAAARDLRRGGRPLGRPVDARPAGVHRATASR